MHGDSIGDVLVAAYVGSHRGLFCCVDCLTGNTLWEIQLDDRIESSPAVAAAGASPSSPSCVMPVEVTSSSSSSEEAVVIVGTYSGSVYGIAAITGRVLYRFQAKDQVKSSPYISSFTTSSSSSSESRIRVQTKEICWIGSHDGNVYGLNAVTGQLLCYASHYFVPQQSSGSSASTSNAQPVKHSIFASPIADVENG